MKANNVELKVWGADSPKTVNIRLVEVSGTIQLQACDNEGRKIHCGNILFITDTGRIVFNESVSPDIGIKVDPVTKRAVVRNVDASQIENF